MNRILYENRCRCNKEFSVTKKRNLSIRSEGKPLQYPESIEITSKVFYIKYEKKLSSIAKLLLNSFRNKYIYYAIDDILDLFKSNPLERDHLLSILYSPIISLQNNFSINFFDIWIHEIYINEVSKVNKFFKNDYSNFEQFNYITIKFLYKTRGPIKKIDSLW
uniref:hypothetical chloroplast RF88 n=1 Tax=Haslea pseudostrearia TaxID=197756 RepID=UPI002209782C|nr:hypothetical chloroplast RF88 [Haslea pseudostrearia]UXN44644.1 hypothetical chloroplast RF88 [Haslea pseudostrearia]